MPSKLVEENLAFWKFHQVNPQVFREFIKIARREKKRRPFYSGRAIIQEIRWNPAIHAGGKPFKIPDIHIARYVRLGIIHHPEEFEGFFKMKKEIDIFKVDDERNRQFDMFGCYDGGEL